jgi:hypothetical protein
VKDREVFFTISGKPETGFRRPVPPAGYNPV